LSDALDRLKIKVTKEEKQEESRTIESKPRHQSGTSVTYDAFAEYLRKVATDWPTDEFVHPSAGGDHFITSVSNPESSASS
jgi:hypothetical protein